MSSAASKAKWVGMLLLQVPVYLVTSYAMRSLLGGSYRLLVKAGANLQPNFLLQHFLFVGLIGGFLAGLLGLLTMRAMLLVRVRTRARAANVPAWKKPQAWTWVISTCWLALGIFAWIAANTHPSALATSSDLSFSGVISVFFGRGCDLSGQTFDRSVLQGCMTQLSYTHPWLGTIGYSAAAFVPTRWTNTKNSSDFAEKIEPPDEEQSQEQQPRPGDVFN
jgi:hypothetical protein